MSAVRTDILRARSRGFTVLELLVALALAFIVFTMGTLRLVAVRDSMSVSGTTKDLATRLAQIRAEAIRERTTIMIVFSSDGYLWTTSLLSPPRGEVSLPARVKWSGGTPSSFAFDGLGLANGFAGTKKIKLESGSIILGVSINPNGHITL